MSDPLVDPSLLEALSPQEREEALAAAAAARRAEERAEQRAMERALAKMAAERQAATSSGGASVTSNSTPVATTINPQIKFVSKRKRLNQSKEQEEQDTIKTKAMKLSTTTPGAAVAVDVSGTKKSQSTHKSIAPPSTNGNDGASKSLSDKERQAIRQTYLGKQKPPTAVEEAKSKRGGGRKDPSKKKTFRFQWDDTDDTLDQSDPLYSSVGLTKQQRHKDPLAEERSNNGNHRRRHALSNNAASVHTKPLDQMSARDWRIYRENYEIVVKGGRAPPPLRNFREAQLHPALLQSIETVLRYTEPTPIQRQSIPIGLQRRDLIGIAETGSGKTAAFGIPLLQYIFHLSPEITSRVADDGPLALVLAPTRELALQIHGEFEKLLSRQSNIKAAAVVGGQSIQKQAQELREGVHVVVGTPGRINECIEMAYMVLNQCCYIVLDECDKMTNMGFKPQMESILDSMGGLLKSENEEEAYQQEEADRLAQTGKGALPRHRLTAMFSATMPLEVEGIAKRYLRHPAVISIGDQDSSKNKRIRQNIIFLASPSHKERALRDLILNPRYLREKVIVFVNEKKHADGIGRMVERIGRQCVVLHGGKSQEQREEALNKFRSGGVVLVATDVAGRGLDIPDVAHVINYDLPSRSIDSYNHRIGRTGRAGREGLATSLLTDEDQGIMAPLKQYLESTGQQVPEKLARHPAANTNAAQGNLIY